MYGKEFLLGIDYGWKTIPFDLLLLTRIRHPRVQIISVHARSQGLTLTQSCFKRWDGTRLESWKGGQTWRCSVQTKFDSSRRIRYDRMLMEFSFGFNITTLHSWNNCREESQEQWLTTAKNNLRVKRSASPNRQLSRRAWLPSKTLERWPSSNQQTKGTILQ